MSVPRCFRCALEVARPTKRINILPVYSLRAPSRTYANVTDAPSPQSTGIETETTQISASSYDKGVENIASPPKRAPVEAVTETETPTSSPILDGIEELRGDEDLPPNVQAAYRIPFKHPRTHGVKVASLQLRSYSVRNLEFMADFALRVATYLKLPVSGPVPLPKRIERWTTIRSNFVHKKSQENFERITLRRLITAYDGHPEVVEIWLACLRKWQYYGVGMKANVFQYEGLDVASKMDKQAKDIEKELDAKLANFGWNNTVAESRSIERQLLRQKARVPGASAMAVRDGTKGAWNVDNFREDFGVSEKASKRSQAV